MQLMKYCLVAIAYLLIALALCAFTWKSKQKSALLHHCRSILNGSQSET